MGAPNLSPWRRRCRFSDADIAASPIRYPPAATMSPPSSQRKKRKCIRALISVIFGALALVSVIIMALLNENVTRTSSQPLDEFMALKSQFTFHVHKGNDTIHSYKQNNATTSVPFQQQPDNGTINISTHKPRSHEQDNVTISVPTQQQQSNNIINVPLGVEHYFWRGRQNRLVKLIKNTVKNYRNGTASDDPHTPIILLNLTIQCKLLYDKLHLGTGNLVLGYYAMRLAAAAGGVDFLFQCIQSNQTAQFVDNQGSIITWLQGYFPAPQHAETFSPFDPPLPTLDLAARGMGHVPLHFMSEAIRHDLRKMAIHLVGPRENRTLVNDATVDVEPILPNVELDDVAIHFRCGDLMKGFNSKNYGIVQYESYREYIFPTCRSIGIVTTSFNESSLRSQDRGTTRTCQVLVNGLVSYLQHAFPRAKISIRNGPEETLALAYARLIMANQTFCSPSTFSIFPTIASFGTGYIQRANMTYFVAPIVEKYSDVRFMDGPLLSALDVGLFVFTEKDQVKRSDLMLGWLMQPFCKVERDGNATDNVITCGNETNLQ